MNYKHATGHGTWAVKHPMKVLRRRVQHATWMVNSHSMKLIMPVMFLTRIIFMFFTIRFAYTQIYNLSSFLFVSQIKCIRKICLNFTLKNANFYWLDIFHAFLLFWAAVPNKFRFSSISSTPQTERYPDPVVVRHSSIAPPQYTQTLPPPHDLRIAPNPVITTRGHPKPLDNIDIAKVTHFLHFFLLLFACLPFKLYQVSIFIFMFFTR